MLTLKEAIEIAEKIRGLKPFGVRDCQDRWIFSFKEDEDKIGGAPVVVFKESGECKFFYVTADTVDLILKGKNMYLSDIK